MNKNIYEIGMEIEMRENRMIILKTEINKETGKTIVDWDKVLELSQKAVNHKNRVIELTKEKLMCITQD